MRVKFLNGKGFDGKTRSETLRMRITNYELRTASLKRYFRILVFLCAFCVFAGNSSAQANLEILAEKINRGDTEQKRDALFQIRNLESAESSRVAVPALTDKAEIVRATAAFSVVFLPKDEASSVLLPLLTDKKELVRREAAYALGKVGNPNAINALVQVLQKDKVADVKNACIVALGEIGDVAAIDALTRILQRKSKAEEEFAHRAAARSVGQIAQIMQTNNPEIRTPESFLREKSSPIEKPKHPKLTEIFPIFRAAVNVLIETLQNPRESSDVKREAAFALGAVGDETAVAVLRANLQAEDYYLAAIAKEALRKISVYANEKGSE